MWFVVTCAGPRRRMMRYEISTEPGDVRPGDLVVFRLQRVLRKCCQALVLVVASPLLLVGFGVCLAAVNLGDWLKEE